MYLSTVAPPPSLSPTRHNSLGLHLRNLAPDFSSESQDTNLCSVDRSCIMQPGGEDGSREGRRKESVEEGGRSHSQGKGT